jgi:hypothetical protein
MRLCVLVVSASLALALAACGGSSNSAATNTTQDAPTTSSASTTPSTSTTAPATTTTVVTSTTSTTTTASAPPPCVAADLALSYLGQQGATGHGELGFALRNTGPRSCHTYGFPGVLFLDKGGGPLPTGDTVSFRLGVTHGVTSTADCTTAYGLQVIPPDDTHTLVTTIPGGAYECRTATVSPLRPASSAYP